MNILETSRLTKYYGKVRGIENVSLTLEEGSFFGFIGPNGAGKSTTIRTLLGLIRPTSGSASIFGRDIRTERNAILADLGYLPAEASFYGGMKVKEILRFSADLRNTGHPSEETAAEASRLCERLALDPDRKIDELSLGNRKKVGIVCALQHRPRLYILDEPTGGLDPLMQREFYAILKERNAEGATIFLSSHVLSEIQRYCTHAAIIRNGSLLISDRVERLGNTSAKRVTLRGVSEGSILSSFRDSAKDVRFGPDSVSFLYSGSPEVLLKTLSSLPLTDVTIAEPDLEEIFLHYYTGEEETV